MTDYVAQAAANASASSFQLPQAQGGLGSMMNGADNTGAGNSMDSDTTDSDLQIGRMQKRDLESRSQALAAQFTMSVESARQLTQLADKVQQLSTQSGLSLADRDAITNSALGVAGITVQEVNNAVADVVKNGNQESINSLMNKAAQNLGMPSTAGLREQLLPALGIRF